MAAEHAVVIWKSGSRALCDHIQSISPGCRIPTTDEIIVLQGS